jgi:hypothetical protein
MAVIILIILAITGCALAAAEGAKRRQLSEELIRAVKEQGKKD